MVVQLNELYMVSEGFGGAPATERQLHDSPVITTGTRKKTTSTEVPMKVAEAILAPRLIRYFSGVLAIRLSQSMNLGGK
jgi:hypothetical protein